MNDKKTAAELHHKIEAPEGNVRIYSALQADQFLRALKAYIFTLNSDFTLTFVSRAVADCCDVEPDTMINCPFTDFIHPEDTPDMLNSLQKVNEGFRQSVEFRLGRPSGPHIWVCACMISATEGINSQKTITGLLIDIQDFKINEKTARWQNRYSCIINSIQEGFFETDLEGHISFCNQSFLTIIGYTSQQIIGKSFRDLTSPRTARSIESVFSRLYKTGKQTKVSNYEIFHKDGHTLTIELTALLITGQDNLATGFRGILRDIPEQINLSKLQQDQQAQLHQSQKMDALGTMAGGLAHGFNNVLMAIQGNLSLMRLSAPLDHLLQRHIERINQSVDKGINLAKQIMTFAKIGKFVVMKTNLNNILKSTSRMFLRSNPNIRIHEFYESNLWGTRVDRVQIGQMLINLYINAAEAMPDGGDLYLQSENIYSDKSRTNVNEVPPGCYVKLSITDSGPGLEDGVKDRIFEPYFSANGQNRSEGFGLAAVYGTIKSHKGFINVYSEKGHGASFNLYFPALTTQQPVSAHTAPLVKGGETILLVDDDESVARISRHILEKHGYRVFLAGTGNEAVELYNEYKNQIDLVILDMILPDINGDQVYKKLIQLTPNLRVLLTSGYNVNKQISMLLEKGCSGFIQKPFQIHPFILQIRKILDKPHL
ncbi:MAG: PAS domain S-box protein [Desulfobacteraceae bacterium]|nr:PAS domain S-box protein [Desulfobacteraceae bacterium]